MPNSLLPHIMQSFSLNNYIFQCNQGIQYYGRIFFGLIFEYLHALLVGCNLTLIFFFAGGKIFIFIFEDCEEENTTSLEKKFSNKASGPTLYGSNGLPSKFPLSNFFLN